jgi:hypothetical protein
MLRMNQLTGFGAGGGKVFLPVTITYVGSNVNSANQASYTFNTQGIGTAFTGRRVILGVKSQVQATSSVTCNGSPMTQLGSPSGGSDHLSFWEAIVDTGTTANFVFTMAGTASNIGFSVWSVAGGFPATIRDRQFNSNNSGLVASVTVTRPVNSGILAIAHGSGSSSATGYSWTGVTERNDFTPEAGTQRYSAADNNTATAASVNVVATLAGSGIVSSRVLAIVP